MTKLQKGVLGAAVALAFSGSSAVYGAATIFFDPDGAGGGGTIAVDTFDWQPGNALAVGALSTAPVIGPGGIPFVPFTLVAQGRLGSFLLPGGGSTTAPGTSEFTFQVSFAERGVGIGTGTSGFVADPTLPSTFSIYRDAVANSNGITGTGFGDGQLILHGTIVQGIGNFTNNTIVFGTDPVTGFPIVLLDSFNADNQNGTLTHQGSGSSRIAVNVDFQDNNFFKSSVSTLTIDLQDTTNIQTPFAQTDPSDQVFGFTPFYSVVGGVRTNGAACPTGIGQDENGNNFARCDIHIQTDASTSFNPVPEPGMLALFGLALGVVGVSARRGRQARG